MLFSFEMEKSTPYAPKELEGEYKLVINGRKMRLTRVDDGTKARATCNKTDNWNMVDGINTCLERIKQKKEDEVIKVGDEVKVVDMGKGYRDYVDWVVENVRNVYDVARYVNGEIAHNGAIGKVVAIAPHGVNDRTLAYIITNDYEPKGYVINVTGLKKI